MGEFVAVCQFININDSNLAVGEIFSCYRALALISIELNILIHFE